MRSDGIVRGIARGLWSLPALFAYPKTADILFVASGTGDSARYRCHHVAEFLRGHGFSVTVSVQGNIFLASYAERFSIVIFHRTSWIASSQKLLKSLKLAGKTVVFDTDDLVFDASVIEASSVFSSMNKLERAQYRRGAGAEFVADSFVSIATTPTHFLAEKLRDQGKRVFVVRNRLCREDIRIADAVYHSKYIEDENMTSSLVVNLQSPVVIGYFSGAKGHDRDFVGVADILADLLARYNYLRLFLAGPLLIPEVLSKYSDRIIRSPYVPRAENFVNMSRVDITIAPLEIGDPFCESKSELKFFEAGIVGVPIVATATDTFQRAITDGDDGFLARSPQEWQEKLKRLILDVGYRRAMGVSAHKTALEKYATAGVESEDERKYIDFLKEHI